MCISCQKVFANGLFGKLKTDKKFPVELFESGWTVFALKTEPLSQKNLPECSKHGFRGGSVYTQFSAGDQDADNHNRRLSDLLGSKADSKHHEAARTWHVASRQSVWDQCKRRVMLLQCIWRLTQSLASRLVGRKKRRPEYPLMTKTPFVNMKPQRNYFSHIFWATGRLSGN